MALIRVRNDMNRRDLLLSILSAADGGTFTPVQIQKAAFLISKNLPNMVKDGPGFAFAPYDYGPFDRNVYIEAEVLRDQGDAIIAASPNGRWLTYAASEQGAVKGQQILNGMHQSFKEYVRAVAAWVRSQPFGSLVKAIYNQYPEMRANSIFKE